MAATGTRLGSQLGNQPEEVVELLQRTPQGCEWLMARWAMLAHSADNQPNGWTPQQTELAFDLLGTPALFREGQKPGASLDIQGRVISGSDDPASVARREIAEIERRAGDVVRRAGGKRHVFNLGHGILPGTPPEHAIALVEHVHRIGAAGHRTSTSPEV